MCTIAILIDVVGGAPIVLAANRDELYARPTLGPRVLDPKTRIVGGLDLLSGGTWLAVRPDGQFAAVTNQVALAVPPPGLRSRGLVVAELAAADDAEAYAQTIDARRYASMNLVWRDRRGVAVGYGRREQGTFEIERLGRGIHVLCNDRLGAPGFPRGVRLQRALEALPLERGFPVLLDPIARALADHTRESLADTPHSHLPPPLARELTATCIHSAEYGTRSATILAVAASGGNSDGVLAYHVADGPACTYNLFDRRGLFR